MKQIGHMKFPKLKILSLSYLIYYEGSNNIGCVGIKWLIKT